MAELSNKDVRENTGITHSEAGKKRAGRKTGSSESSSSANSGRAGRGRAGRGRGTAGTEENKSADKSIELPVIVEAETEKPVEVKVEKPKAPKPKPLKRKKKKADNVEQISGVIQGVSALVACRPDKEHWLITEEEANKIAEPLSNILANSEAFAKVAEHSDAMALCFATAMVIVPRAMAEVTIQKNKPKRERRRGRKAEVIINDNNSDNRLSEADRGNEKRKSERVNRTHDVESTAIHKADALNVAPVESQLFGY